jgi:TatD DNase family protein
MMDTWQKIKTSLEDLPFMAEGRSLVPLIETHCHLDMLKSVALQDVLQRCDDLNIQKLITISTSPDNLEVVLKLAGEHENVFCSQGIHPHEAKHFNSEILEKIKKTIDKKILAIGEIGLDYHYLISSKESQIRAFHQQAQLACELDLPIILHTREAEEQTMETLRPFKGKLKGVAHSFTSSLNLAKFLVEEMGFYLGFNGIITFKNAENVRAVAKWAPLKRILLETDAPFLAPTPHRGKENTPYLLPFVALTLCKLKNLAPKQCLTQIHQNTHELFSF